MATAGTVAPRWESKAPKMGFVGFFDGLRGVGVGMVLIGHALFEYLESWVTIVDTFFVLSGFLITYLMLTEQSKTGRMATGAFYRRRALRLLPAIAAFVVIFWIYSLIAGMDQELVRGSLLSTAFYYTNWYLAYGPKNFLGGGIIADGMQHLWSLSFEEQFYLIWPVVTIFFLTIRTRLRTVVIVLVSVMVLVALHRAHAYQSALTGDFNHDRNVWYPIMIRTDTRVDSILIGALLAHVWIRNKIPTRFLNPLAWVAAIFLLICLPLVQVQQPFLYLGGISLIDIAIATMLLAIVEGNWGGQRLFLLKPFLLIGLVSYGLYLWHLPILFAVQRYGMGWHPAVRVIVSITLCAAFTIGSWFLVEKPAMRWKTRLEARSEEKRAARDLERGGDPDPAPDPARASGEGDRTVLLQPAGLAAQQVDDPAGSPKGTGLLDAGPNAADPPH